MQYIEGYEGLYLVSEDGKVHAKPSNKRPEGCILRPWLIGHGYESVMLYKDKKPSKYLVHRLVAQAFIPNPESLPEVNHKDGNRLNSRSDNLEWVSSKQNKRHAWASGLYTHSKLTEEEVKEIRVMYSTGKYRQQDIADQFNTSQVQISWIVRRKGWSHVS